MDNPTPIEEFFSSIPLDFVLLEVGIMAVLIGIICIIKLFKK